VTNISNAARDIPQLFKSELQKDEKIVWTGRPEPQWFSSADIVAIPFSIVWGGFAYFWEFSVVKIYLAHPKEGPGLLMVFWGIPFVCIGTYMMFGRFFYQYWQQKNTFYAVTNQRILILTTSRGRSTQALFIDQLPEISKIVNKKGVGSLLFGGDPRLAGLTVQMGSPLSRRRNTVLPPAFSNIKDVDKVYELIAKQRKPR
jgi:hypothetical protein